MSSHSMRARQYPLIPQIRGKPLAIVLPRKGEFSVRQLLPDAFLQQFRVHIYPQLIPLYTNFVILRKFIVMSKDGSLYTKQTRTTISYYGLPNKIIAPMAIRLQPWDITNVSDLVQCQAIDQNKQVCSTPWELVRVRWRNGEESWLSIDIVELTHSHLLQKFYVNSINSWAFHNRLHADSLSRYYTEVELWLYHDEFQQFYEKLRMQRMVSVAQATSDLSNPFTTSSDTTIPMPSVQIPALPYTDQMKFREEQVQLDEEKYQITSSPRQNGTQETPIVHSIPYVEGTSNSTSSNSTTSIDMSFTQSRRNSTFPINTTVSVQSVGQNTNEMPDYTPTSLESNINDSSGGSTRYLAESTVSSANSSSSESTYNPTERIAHYSSGESPNYPAAIGVIAASNSSGKSSNDPTATGVITAGNSHRESPCISAAVSVSTTNNSSVESLNNLAVDVESTSSNLSGERSNKFATNIETCDTPVCDKISNGQIHDTARETNEDNEKGAPIIRRRGRLVQHLTNSNDEEDGLYESDNSLQEFTQSSEKIQPESKSKTKVPVLSTIDNRPRKRLRQQMSINTCDSSDTSEEFPESVIHMINENIVNTKDDKNLLSSAALLPGCICGEPTNKLCASQLLKCQKRSCRRTEHADCVGVVINNIKPIFRRKYICSVCDRNKYIERYKLSAINSIIPWMFQCCKNRHVKQLIRLIHGHYRLKIAQQTHAINEHVDLVRLEDKRTVLMEASGYGLYEAVELLIRGYQQNVFATDTHKRNALHYAASGGHMQCVQFLINFAIKLLFHQDITGQTAFHWMLRMKKFHEYCLELLVSHTSLVHISDYSGNSPIHFVCEGPMTFQSAEIICHLLNEDPALMFEESERGLTPFALICFEKPKQKGDILHSESAQSIKQVIQKMLEIDVLGQFFSEKDPDGDTVIHWSLWNSELVKLLCRYSTDFPNLDLHATNNTCDSALHLAAKGNNHKCISILQRHNLDSLGKNSHQLIPILYATDPLVLQEFLHFDLIPQLFELNDLYNDFKRRWLVTTLQRTICLNPNCFDVLNDQLLLLDDLGNFLVHLEDLFLHQPFLLRFDVKLHYVFNTLLPTLRNQMKHSKLKVCILEKGNWSDIQAQLQSLCTSNFRFPLAFSWSKICDLEVNSGSEPFLFSIGHLLGFIGSILVENTEAMFARDKNGYLELIKPNDDEIITGVDHVINNKSLSYYLLGQLTANAVLFEFPLRDSFVLSKAFLQLVLVNTHQPCQQIVPLQWILYAQSFALGFEGVIPGFLKLFNASELMLILWYSCNDDMKQDAASLNWDVILECNNEQDKHVKELWLRLLKEIRIEDKLLLLKQFGTLEKGCVNGTIDVAMDFTSFNSLGSHYQSNVNASASHESGEEIEYNLFKKKVLVSMREGCKAFLTPNW